MISVACTRLSTMQTHNISFLKETSKKLWDCKGLNIGATHIKGSFLSLIGDTAKGGLTMDQSHKANRWCIMADFKLLTIAAI